MKLILEDDPRAWRRFTWTVLPAPAVLGTLLWWKGRLPTPGLFVWLGLLLGAALLSGVRPAWFGGFYRAGMKAGYHLTRVLGWIGLTLIFFVVVTPLGLVLRLAGHDPLRLRHDRNAATYWRSPRPRHDLERMF